MTRMKLKELRNLTRALSEVSYKFDQTERDLARMALDGDMGARQVLADKFEEDRKWSYVMVMNGDDEETIQVLLSTMVDAEGREFEYTGFAARVLEAGGTYDDIKQMKRYWRATAMFVDESYNDELVEQIANELDLAPKTDEYLAVYYDPRSWRASDDDPRNGNNDSHVIYAGHYDTVFWTALSPDSKAVAEFLNDPDRNTAMPEREAEETEEAPAGMGHLADVINVNLEPILGPNPSWKLQCAAWNNPNENNED